MTRNDNPKFNSFLAGKFRLWYIFNVFVTQIHIAPEFYSPTLSIKNSDVLRAKISPSTLNTHWRKFVTTCCSSANPVCCVHFKYLFNPPSSSLSLSLLHPSHWLCPWIFQRLLHVPSQECIGTVEWWGGNRSFLPLFPLACIEILWNSDQGGESSIPPSQLESSGAAS